MIREGIATYPYSPYCGAPPAPATLAVRWNLDPILLAALGLIVLAYWLWSRPSSAAGIATWRRGCFLGGWAIASLALVSPLCPLSVSLFSARVGQHMILTVLAAPLVALGQPGKAAPPTTKAAAALGPVCSAVAFAAALWFWHSPEPYRATFESDAAYWAMHLTTFGAALWLWSDLLDPARRPLAGLAAAAALTTAQMAVLGAAITFASRPLYSPHFLTTAAWGLTPLEDQQLGGVFMWAPAGVIFSVGMVLLFAQALRRAEARSRQRAAAWARR
jgi:putative membrane protein